MKLRPSVLALGVGIGAVAGYWMNTWVFLGFLATTLGVMALCWYESR